MRLLNPWKLFTALVMDIGGAVIFVVESASTEEIRRVVSKARAFSGVECWGFLCYRQCVRFSCHPDDAVAVRLSLREKKITILSENYIICSKEIPSLATRQERLDRVRALLAATLLLVFRFHPALVLLGATFAYLGFVPFAVVALICLYGRLLGVL